MGAIKAKCEREGRRETRRTEASTPQEVRRLGEYATWNKDRGKKDNAERVRRGERLDTQTVIAQVVGY